MEAVPGELDAIISSCRLSLMKLLTLIGARLLSTAPVQAFKNFRGVR